MTKSFCLCYDFNPRSPHGERPSAGLRTQYFPFISIHAPRTGSDRTGNTQVKARFGFQSTLPARGATRQFHADAQRDSISIHAPRTGSDTSGGAFRALLSRFQSTLPARGATRARHALRRTWQISIHAPRTGSDPATNNCQGVAHISIHAPRTGSDNNGDDEPCVHARFQSTLPARGATWRASAAKKPASYFNPRSPHGERRPSAAQSTRFTNFNPRSPHGERPHLRRSSGVRNGFQSTLPARGATQFGDGGDFALLISIHAPRTGSDGQACDERPRKHKFQSTLPARGATAHGCGESAGSDISIHAPRTGSDIPRR